MPPLDRPRRATNRRILVISLLLILSGGAISVYYFWPRQKPSSLFKRAMIARKVEDRISLLQQAITAADGNYPAAEAQLCVAVARTKDWDKLATVFGKLDKASCPPQDLVTLAELCLAAEQWKPAEEVLEALKEKPIPTEQKWLLFCSLYHGTGRHRELIDATEQLTKVAPNDPRYWWQLAQIHEELENTVAAIRTYSAAFAHDLPQSEKVNMRHRLLDQCIDVGDASLARQQLEALRTAGEGGPRMDVYEARLSHLEGHPEQALNSLEAALRELGEIPEALRLRGILNFELGRLEPAATDLRRVIELAPNDEIAVFKLAETYRLLDRGQMNQEFQKLARRYHERYLVIHNRQHRIKELKRQLSQTPNDAASRTELERLQAELAENKAAPPKVD